MALKDLFSGTSSNLTPQLPWAGSMVPQAVGEGNSISYPNYKCSSVRLEWVSRSEGANGPLTRRTPVESTKVYPMLTPFHAAGKSYFNLGMLTKKTDKDRTFCRDAYGRQVLCLRERFPCFDSEDFLHENRYYRWFFLLEGDRLTRIYHTDESGKVFVTEDVLDLETWCWEQMMKLGCFS